MGKFATFQIGKNGITEGIVDSLILAFKNHKIVRISLLQASGRERESTEDMANEIVDRLTRKSEYSYTYSIIGFKVLLRRHVYKSRKK